VLDSVKSVTNILLFFAFENAVFVYLEAAFYARRTNGNIVRFRSGKVIKAAPKLLSGTTRKSALSPERSFTEERVEPREITSLTSS
jgi:hypothetical protein